MIGLVWLAIITTGAALSALVIRATRAGGWT
jgi:hypothetical protein